MPNFIHKLLFLTFSGVILLLMGACASSSDGGDENADTLANSESEDGADANKSQDNTTDDSGDNSEENTADNGGNAGENTADNQEPAPNANTAPAEPAPLNAAPPPAPLANAAPPANQVPAPIAAVPAVAVSGEGREVRYIGADDTPVYQTASDSAQQLVKLHQGDIVVVQIQGDWAQITPDHFIKTAALSQKAVPRNFMPAVWQDLASKQALAPLPAAAPATPAAPAPMPGTLPTLAPNAAAGPGFNAAAPAPGANAAAPAANAAPNAANSATAQ